MSEVSSAERLDFFVSHAGPDDEWAMWLAQQLQNAGYTVELDVWNWSAGIDVIQVTQRALDRARRVLAVWSPEYFTRRWADMEHRVSFARSQKEPGWLLPVVVRACPEEAIPLLYRTLIRVDLVGLTEARARERLLAAVAGPSRPTAKLAYPGEQELGSYPGRLPPIWNVPNRNAFFVGRATELAGLAEQLAVPGSAAAVVGVEGTSGIGKSELAVEYAWRHASEFGLVWWMDAGHQATAEASLIELAALLDAPVTSGVATVVPALRTELELRADWLLIVDNVPGWDQLRRLLPTRAGRVLVTSNDANVLPTCRPVVLRRFSRAESAQLLRHRCSWLTEQAAGRIAATVDDLPVAVAQAAQFLARTGMVADEYLPMLTEQVTSMVDQQPGAEAGLAATVAVGQERLLALDPAAADLLDQLALLAAEPVPLTAAASHAADGGAVPGLVVSDPETTGELVSSICELGLAVRVGTHVQLQARVRSLIAEALTAPRRALVLGRVLRLLATADPGDPGSSANWPLYATLAPHVLAATARLHETAGVTETARFQRLLDQICHYLRLAGRAQDGCELAEAAYLRRRHTHGDDDPETLRWAVNRGMALGALGRHEQARQILTDALTRLRQVAGADQPETLHTADRLGVTMIALGDHDAARLLLQDTLARRRRTLGPDAVATLRSAANLGTALSSLGYHTQARHVLEDVITSRRRVLGADHLDTLAAGHELGVVLAALGDRDAARGVLAEVVARRKEALGADHLDTLAAGHELGVVLAALGDHGAAREALEEVTAGRRAALGADHRDALASAHELGAALAALGDRVAAKAVLDDTAARRRRTLGPSHPETLHTERICRWLR